MIQSFSPITFKTGLSNYRTVADVAAAANYLLTQWPEHRGTAYTRAQKVCLDAMLGRKKPAKARDAFLRALGEAGIWVREP
jgi:hypothetical protein